MSVEEAGKFSPAMADILKKANCSPKKLWQAVQRSRPNLIKKTIHIRPPLSPEVRSERQSAAELYGSLTEEDLKRIVFIDEKTLYVKPCTAVGCICPKGTFLPICEDGRLLKGGRRNRLVIKGIFAVNPVIGAVLWRPLSGSCGFETPYKVRAFTRTCPPTQQLYQRCLFLTFKSS